MRRAIGLPAFQFKGLYIASYLFLSVIGGTLGLIVGIPLSRYVTEYFILFCFMVVRKIDKQSVVSALNNGVEGNGVEKVSKHFLHRHSKISVPSFMALKETLALQHIAFRIESCPNCLIYSDPNAL